MLSSFFPFKPFLPTKPKTSFNQSPYNVKSLKPIATMNTKQTTEPTWPQLLGSNNWEGLLDPLNLSLRKLILRCGDLIQTTYDTFNNDTNSRFCGSCRFGKKSYFYKAMFEAPSDYFVYSFLYATAEVSVPEEFLLHSMSREAWDRESNWIGYIGVTSDEVSKKLNRREIYVAWRGTTRDYEWIDVVGAELESAKVLLRDGGSKNEDDDDKDVKVERGWLSMYITGDPRSPFTTASARTQLQTKMKELMNQYKDEKLSVTFIGHSLGGALSVLSAFDLVENGILDNIPVAAIVFGLPMVGNKAFNEKIKSFPNLKILHIKNTIDLIPHYPGRLLGYVYTGIELVIDSRKSPNLKESDSPGDWHNLQAMLHVVDGWHGEKGKFELQVPRSLALVNKSSAILKDEYLIPGSWWAVQNKGMVLVDGGEWVLAPPSDEDLPVPEI